MIQVFCFMAETKGLSLGVWGQSNHVTGKTASSALSCKKKRPQISTYEQNNQKGKNNAQTKI